MEKSQDIRILDIFILGPFTVWSAFQKDVPEWLRPWMLMSGIGTILYNYTTYKANQ